LIILFAAISVAGIIGNSLTPTGDRAQLGITGGIRRGSCTGDLTVTSRELPDGRCGLQAALTMYNCEGNEWYVFEGSSCSGIYMCKGNVNEPTSIWKCSWEVNTGTYTYTLCDSSGAKDTSTVSC
jgi:hypothetical protein